MLRHQRDRDGHPLIDAAAVAWGLRVSPRRLREIVRKHPDKLRRVRRTAHGSWLYRREDVERLAEEREAWRNGDQRGTV